MIFQKEFEIVYLRFHTVSNLVREQKQKESIRKFQEELSEIVPKIREEMLMMHFLEDSKNIHRKI
jgi:hypothetical protein